MKRKDEMEKLQQETMLQDYLSYKITNSLIGEMTPSRDGIIRVLNQKRRKEGIYAKQCVSTK